MDPISRSSRASIGTPTLYSRTYGCIGAHTVCGFDKIFEYKIFAKIEWKDTDTRYIQS